VSDITDLKHDLVARVRQVVPHLLPNGVKAANEWRVGSLGGEKGQSLAVHLSGDKAGVWCDFQSGETGDLIDLWAQVRRVPLSDALNEIRDHLGKARPAPHSSPKRDYARPPKPKCAAPQGKVRDYLCEIRNIPGHILDVYKVGEQGDLIVFPFLLPGGELALAKTRKAEDGAKPKPTAAGCEPVLFGWQAVPPNAREVVLTEGEIDALSLAAYGFAAMSVPFGGGGGAKQQWIENEFERMERFEKIFIATDMDKPGDEAAAEIASRLGRHRCYRVKLPRKDANACLMDGVGKDEIAAAIVTADSLDPDGLRRAEHFTDAVIQWFWPDGGAPAGYTTPYGTLKDKLLFRPGEMTLWTGASGSGKSQILSDCAVDWIRQGSRVCISSLEMKGAATLSRMSRQVAGVKRPTKAAIRQAMDWFSPGLLLYDFIGKASVAKLIEVFDYARAKHGCDQFILDSLMRLGIASDDYVGQEKAVFDMVEWATAAHVHLHVVAHARKGGLASGAAEIEDIKGASEIGSNAFNVISVWRNRSLEDDIRKAELAKNEDIAKELREKPGVILNVAKQRSGDFEGKVGLWFDLDSYRYHSSYERNSSSGRTYLDSSLTRKFAREGDHGSGLERGDDLVGRPG
jgi:twinkle protein